MMGFVITGLDPAIHHKRFIQSEWMPGSSPRLSGLILVDKAHGVDSSAVLSIAKCSRHTRKIPPCATTIQYFTTF